MLAADWLVGCWCKESVTEWHFVASGKAHSKCDTSSTTVSKLVPDSLERKTSFWVVWSMLLDTLCGIQ